MSDAARLREPKSRRIPSCLPRLPSNRDATREVAMEAKKSLSQIERTIVDHAADSHLRTLVNGGCSRAGTSGWAGASLSRG